MKKYRTICADPPWPYADPYVSFPGSVDRQHKIRKPLPFAQMSVADIAALPVSDLAERDAHLWLWATNHHLPDAFMIITAWGFRFRQILVWHKTGSPSPFPASVAPNHAEFLLFAVRGKLPLRTRLKSNVVQAPKQYAHSRKPEVFQDRIEEVSPGPYLELFARRQRLGWDSWGNEAFKHVDLEVPA